MFNGGPRLWSSASSSARVCRRTCSSSSRSSTRCVWATSSPGDQLPKVRDVVAKLAINPNTVSKAYRELETKGLAVGRPGQGTFIAATLKQVALPELTELRRSLVSWVAIRGCSGARRRRDDGARRERAAGCP